MNYITTKDANRREHILFGRDYDRDNYRLGGISYFKEASPKVIRELISVGFADPEEAQNSSPTIREFLEFIESQPDPENWYLHGYSVSPEREDVRVSIEGIGSYGPVASENLADFVMENRFADTLDIMPDHKVYCWYD